MTGPPVGVQWMRPGACKLLPLLREFGFHSQFQREQLGRVQRFGVVTPEVDQGGPRAGCSARQRRPRSLASRKRGFSKAATGRIVETVLLRKSVDGRGSPFPGRTHPTASVMGVPSAVKPFSTATRTWNSAT